MHFIHFSVAIQNGGEVGNCCVLNACFQAKMSTIDQLKSEVERLSSELQQACLEKVQAAEYGLAVLEEKQRLQEQYEDLETALDANKQELDCLKEVGFIVICRLFIRKFVFKFSSLICLGSRLRIEKTNKSFINTLNYLSPAGLA